MPRRAPICDVPDCGRSRARWQRLCQRCFTALPGDIRTGIIDAHRQRRAGAWRAACARAAEHLRTEADRAADRAQAAALDAYERQRRLTGDRS